MSSSVGPRRTKTTWLDVALLLVTAVITSAAGVAAQSVWDLPWDPARPPAASAATRQQLAEAQQRARDLSLSRDEFAAQVSKQRVNRTVLAVKLDLATGQDAVSLSASIRESSLVIAELQDRATAAVRAGVEADQQIAIATEDVTKSREAAERRSHWITAGDRLLFGITAWATIALVVLLAVRRSPVPNRRMALTGSLAVLLVIRGVSDVGWLVTAAVVVGVAVAWICRPVAADG